MAIFLLLRYIAFICGELKGELKGYQEGIRFGYLAAKDGAELLCSDNEKS